MKTILYYFTGTGNSLAAAKKIAAALGDCEVVPIATLMDTKGDVIPAAERVGIVCPVYFSGLPAMVGSFARRLDPAGVTYLFALVTHGGGGGSAALRQLDAIVKKRAGRGLDAGFTVTMPGNYILMYESLKDEARRKILAGADAEILAIAGSVRQGSIPQLPSSLIVQVLHSLLYPWFLSHVHNDDRKFTVTDACTACGTCVAVCPANNIRLVDKKPVFQHHCELCCSCIHNCPVRAIQAGTKTEKRERYRNPEVTVADLKLRKGE